MGKEKTFWECKSQDAVGQMVMCSWYLICFHSMTTPLLLLTTFTNSCALLILLSSLVNTIIQKAKQISRFTRNQAGDIKPRLLIYLRYLNRHFGGQFCRNDPYQFFFNIFLGLSPRPMIPLTFFGLCDNSIVWSPAHDMQENK